VADWYSEKRSATTMAREELRRLLADARAGLLRGRRLYLFRLDRLTRTGIADQFGRRSALIARSWNRPSVA
jgi:DNA invertase Pin-like site-specific DNA recombinase